MYDVGQGGMHDDGSVKKKEKKKRVIHTQTTWMGKWDNTNTKGRYNGYEGFHTLEFS